MSSSPDAMHRAIERRLAEGDSRRALRAAKALVSAGHDDTESLLLLARTLEQVGRWAHAAHVYAQLVARDPGDEAASSRLAVALARSGPPAISEAAAAELYPASGSAAALAARAAVAEAAGETSEAVALRRELLELGPDSPQAVAELALALARADEHAKAASVLAAAQQRQPRNAHVARASVLVAAERPDSYDLGPWRELVNLDHVLLADVVNACARRGKTTLALHLLAEAHSVQLHDPLPRALVALIAQREARAGQTIEQLVRALDRVPSSGWARVFKPLVKSGRYTLARALVVALQEQRPGDAGLAELSSIAETLPDDADIPEEISRELAAEQPLVVIPAPQPVATALVFTGNVGASQLLHAHLATRRVAAVYLRHFKPRLYFLDGIPGEAEGYDAAVERLRELRNRFGGPLYVIGQSMPGFAAIRYAIDLEADRVLGLNAPTDLSPEFIAGDRRSPRTYARIQTELPEMAVNLAPLLAASPHPPRVCLYYNADAQLDAAQAKRLEDAPGVSLHPVPGGDRHNALFPMLRGGLIGDAIDELFGDS